MMAKSCLGIKSFKYIMEHYILKDILKKEYKNNSFAKNLRYYQNKKTNRKPRWTNAFFQKPPGGRQVGDR